MSLVRLKKVGLPLVGGGAEKLERSLYSMQETWMGAGSQVLLTEVGMETLSLELD